MDLKRLLVFLLTLPSAPPSPAPPDPPARCQARLHQRTETRRGVLQRFANRLRPSNESRWLQAPRPSREELRELETHQKDQRLREAGGGQSSQVKDSLTWHGGDGSHDAKLLLLSSSLGHNDNNKAMKDLGKHGAATPSVRLHGRTSVCQTGERQSVSMQCGAHCRPLLCLSTSRAVLLDLTSSHH